MLSSISSSCMERRLRLQFRNIEKLQRETEEERLSQGELGVMHCFIGGREIHSHHEFCTDDSVAQGSSVALQRVKRN